MLLLICKIEVFLKESDKMNLIRPAVINDLYEIRRVYDNAKEYMDRTGNPTQWQKGHPNNDIIKTDIGKKQLFLITDENDCIHGVFALMQGLDPTYSYIENGNWLNELPYVTLHRVASDGVLRGIVNTAVEYALSTNQRIEVRIDTHENNTPMQKALYKIGFERCGIIYLANGDPRIAFQLKK